VITPGKTEPTVGDLLGDLARDTGVLVRQEMQLAAAEMNVKLRTLTQNAILVVVGAGLALLGLLALLLAAIFALDLALPLWAAALVVGALITIPGVVLLMKGLSTIKSLDPLPQRTLTHIKDDVGALKGAFP
jgi:uncharacterized membrane protein YqjE